MTGLLRRLGRREGQGMVEFAVTVPVFLLILLGMLEFGFVFDQAMTLNYATREGARSAAAFASGSDAMPCTSSVDVDKHIIAAVQRVLDSPGSRVTSADVGEIRIYKANASGTQTGTSFNRWTYVDNGGPAVDGANLDFNAVATNWSACTRDNSWTNGVAPDSIGVSITYTYRLITPLASILGFFGGGGSATIPISDRTVMALNPTN